MNDLPPPRKAPHKAGRLGLYLPFALAILLTIAWGAGWIWLRGEARARMDAGVTELKAAGYDITWKDRQITGFPFRFNVTLTEARVREPSGWGLEAPRIESEARMLAPGNWIVAATEGATFIRPVGGPVQVKGKAIRASLTNLAETPPRFSFEGRELTFQPGAGAQPFALQSADLVEFHLRGNKALDEGLVSFKVDNGKARLAGLFGRIAGERPISISWTATLTKMAAFKGNDWPGAVRSWIRAGGRMNVRQAGVTAGEAVLGSNAGQLTVDSTGRLAGVLDVTLRQAPRALTAMGEMGTIPEDRAEAAAAVAAARTGTGDVAQARIHFEAGQTTLGPVAVGPAPLVYR